MAATDLEALYTSAPIFDEDDARDLRPADEEVLDVAGVMPLAPEVFDAAVLEALVHP